MNNEEHNEEPDLSRVSTDGFFDQFNIDIDGMDNLMEGIDKIEKWFTEMQLLAQGPVDNETVFLEKQHAKDILDNEIIKATHVPGLKVGKTGLEKTFENELFFSKSIQLLNPSAFANSSLKVSKEPKAVSIAAASSPVGLPPAFGAIISQNISGLAC
mgnify:CR=1 FL=1